MQKLMKDYLEELRRQKKRRRKAAVAVVLLVTLVVGTVTSGLTQYGIAMTEEYHCGLKEHKHTDECYEDVLICGYGDTDDAQEEDNSAEDSAENPEDGSGQPDTTESKEDKAGQSDAAKPQEGHQHTADCYEVEDVLDCDLEESKGHTHDEDCYETEEVMVCEEKEVEGHTHDETCYETEKVLDCKEDHEHTEDCYRTENTLTCGKDETEGHTHGKDCYKSESVLTCKEEESEGHTHGKDCYKQEKVLKCGKEESKEDQTESAASKTTPSDPKTDTTSNTIVDPKADEAQHVHTKDCYEHRLVCGLEEHTHTAECLIDKTADVEDMSVWDAQYEDVEWADAWGEDLVTAASEQIGYKESLDNYQIAEDGSHQGYTRYGEFAGDPYMDWDTAFVNFCMHYAGLTESGLFPDKTDAAEWMEEFVKLQEERGEQEEHKEYLTAPEDYTPRAGDLIFFDRNADDKEEENEEEALLQMGIVSFYEEEENEEGKNEIKVIEGDSDHAVKENTYDAADVQIVQYLKITELETDYKAAQEDPSGLPDEKNENGLTQEEQAQVDAVIALIEALPTMEDVAERFAALEEDEEGYAAYYQELYEQVLEAKNAYDALTEAQKLAVTNAEKLMQYEWLWTDNMDETEGEEADHQARITSFEITRTVDGTTPFDNHKEHTKGCYDVNYFGDEDHLICTQTLYKDDDSKHNEPGDDRSSDNRVVRTFDSVNYKFRVAMASYEKGKTFNDARVKLQVILPLTKEQAEFNTGAMTWMDETPGYMWEIKDAVLGEDQKLTILEPGQTENANCQVLTCWKHLTGGRSVIPGFFENNVSVNVKSMKNDDEFAPTFYAVLENGCEYTHQDAPQPQPGEEATPEKYQYTYEEQHQCATHKEVEMWRADAPKIKVSAAPKYNIRISGADSERLQYNFNDIQGEPQTDAANIGKGFQTGRMVRIGVTIQLYNNNASKGIKGIELPKEDVPITFDLELESKYHINTPNSGSKYQAGEDVDVTGIYTPLLWSCGPNIDGQYGDVNIDGRVIYDQYWGDGLAPYSDGGGSHACKESGTWTAEQEGSTIHVIVTGYSVDVNQMPAYNRGQDEKADSPAYGKNVGSFSSGVIWILQPFNRNEEGKEGDETGKGNRDPNFDVITDYGQGAFYTKIIENNMKITGVSGTKVGNDKQMYKKDDESPHGLELTLPGVMQNRVRYSSRDISKGVGVDSIRNGRDYTSIGSEIWLMGGFSYSMDGKEENQFYYGTNLLKFDSKAIRPLEDEPINDQWAAIGEKTGGSFVPGHSHLQTYFGGDAQASAISVYYAAKPNGANWTDDNEMMRTYEDDLVFYKHMDQLENDGKQCVGILYCFKGPGKTEENLDPGYECFHRAIVKPDETLVGDGKTPMTYQIVSTSRVWTKKMFGDDESALDRLPSWTTAGTSLDSFPSGYMQSANVEGSVFYEKAVYHDDGRGIDREHNSDWYRWGDTLLIIGYKTYIEKNLMQKNGTEEKRIFDLDTNQRVVDFGLVPSTGYDLAVSQGGNYNPNLVIPVITIVDTLPQYLRYKEGSAYLGGSYKQISDNGGMQGIISGGTAMDQPLSENEAAERGPTLTWEIEKPDQGVVEEPVIIDNEEEGTQTLIWKFYNKKVGEPLPTIYYSADIGDRRHADRDVPEGTTELLNTVRITAKLDRRDPSLDNGNYAEAGIAVTKGNAGSYGKYALQNAVEEDGEIEYVVYYDNNGENPISLAVMDVMPAHGKNGSSFTGKYVIESCKLNMDLCDAKKLNNNIKVYYTIEPKYQDMTLSDKDSGFDSKVIEDQWIPVSIGQDGSIVFPREAPEGTPAGQPPITAWGIVGELDNGNCIEISLKIRLIPEKPTDPNAEREIFHYVNLFSTKDITTEIDTPTVRRSLEGLAWMDYNRNGRQDEGEDQVAGVNIHLLKLKPWTGDGEQPEDYAKDIKNYAPVPWNLWESEAGESAAGEAVIRTGQQVSLRIGENGVTGYQGTGTGRYRFTDLSAGIYAVQFTKGEGDADLSKMRATIYDCMDNIYDTDDSDGVPVYKDNDSENGELQETYILGIEMKSADIISKEYPDRHQKSPYHDSGFYYKTELELLKVGEDWNTRLPGASFIISGSDGSTINFRKEDGTYLAPIDLGDGLTSRARYYIEYADYMNNSYSNGQKMAIGVTKTEGADGSWLKTFPKAEHDEWQLFELYSREDGSFSFRHCATGKWIDLDSGKTNDETTIQIWQGNNDSGLTTNPHQIWYITPNGDGSCRIQGKNGRNNNWAFMDVSNNQPFDGARIWGYHGNNSAAQNWCLVPENEGSMLEVDENGVLRIKDLLPGDYTIKEMKTPAGCMVLDQPIRITVEKNGTVTVKDGQEAYVRPNGEPVNGKTSIKVCNHEMYELPSTGGIGIYWYTISGTLLMMAGVLILYRKKRAGRC